MGTPTWKCYVALAIGAKDWVRCTLGRGMDIRYRLSRVSAEGVGFVIPILDFMLLEVKRG